MATSPAQANSNSSSSSEGCSGSLVRLRVMLGMLLRQSISIPVAREKPCGKRVRVLNFGTSASASFSVTKRGAELNSNRSLCAAQSSCSKDVLGGCLGSPVSWSAFRLAVRIRDFAALVAATYSRRLRSFAPRLLSRFRRYW